MDVISLATSGSIALKLAGITAVPGSAKLLVEKICGAVGTLYEPVGKILAAHADVQVEKIKAFGQLDLDTAIQQRTLGRLLRDQERIQVNVESIAAQATDSLSPDAKPEEMDDDWIANVMDKCKNVSNNDMQSLWAKILAGEANKKGSFSKQTIQTVSVLEKSDAMLFTKLCGYVWYVNTSLSWYPLVFLNDDPMYKKEGIDYSALAHLASLGLLSMGSSFGNYNVSFPSTFTVAAYRGKPYRVSKTTAPLVLDTGQVMLTTAGAQLSQIAGSTEVKDFSRYVVNKWASSNLIVEEMSDWFMTNEGQLVQIIKANPEDRPQT